MDAVTHEQEIIDAYASAGIECLTLWEHDVMGRWNQIEPMVCAWIGKAIKDINENPIWRKSTSSKVDKRKASLECPFGSGRKFKTQKSLDRWLESPANYYRDECIEGHDYVVCQICNGRFQKLTEHLRKFHEISKDRYNAQFPDSQTVAGSISEAVSRSCSENPRRGGQIKNG